MRGVIAHGPTANSRDLRQILLGSGLDCEAADIVSWESLPVRLGQQDADVVVALMDQAAECDWRAVEQGKRLTAAPLVVVGDSSLKQRADSAGAMNVIDQPQLRQGLDDAVSKITAQRGQGRGKVISVLAPTPGSGGTTVACNLGAALAKAHPGQVGLIELAREFGDLALLLDVQPEHTAEQACQRWRLLDAISLRSSLHGHRSGLQVLVNSPDRPVNEHLHQESVRRLAVLARMALGYTVLALDNRLGECELEAMQLSDAVALVVRPDVPSVKRAHWALLQAVEQGVPRDRFQLVINRFGQRGSLPRSQVEAALQLRTLQQIPDDPRSVNRAVNRGELVRERSPLRRISRRFSALARSLNGRS